jgi:signal transduction histidine kinase/predicted negative regulator of RcsB-dependent stress response
MKSPFVIIYIVLAVLLFSGCEPEPSVIDGKYKSHCFNLLDKAVDECKASHVSKMDSCYQSIFSIDTIKGINTDIWRGYAKAKGLFHHNFFKESEKMISELIRASGDPSLLLEQAKLLQLRGMMEETNNQQSIAAKDFYRSINIYLQLGLQRDASICYASIANIHHKAANYKIAIENAHRALALPSLTRSDSMRTINVYNTIAISFIEMHNTDSALHYFTIAENIASRVHAEFWVGLINGNVAKILVKEGRLLEALDRLSTDVRISRKYNEVGSVTTALISKGDIYTTLGNFKTAKQYYDSAHYLLTNKVNDKIILTVYYRHMAQFSRHVEQFKNADTYFQQYVHLRDSLQGINVGKNLEDIQNMSYMEKQLADINLLKIENGYKTKQVLLWQLCIGTIAFALVLVVIFYRSKRLHNRQLTLLNSELEEKVKDRTTELMKTNEELDTYLYRASHDVRRPILSIIGLAQIAAFAQSPEEQLDIQQKIISTGQEMDKMLNKLKMTYDLRANMESAVLDLYQYIEGLSKSIGKFYPQAKFMITKSGDMSLTSDLRFITMVLSNLIENACIFHHQVAEVKVEVTGEPNYIYVRIADNGIGIQEEYRERIFDAYTRFSERSVGSGIGLYIVARALAKIGGDIEVESILYKGSTFTVKLPRRKYI